MGRSFTASKEEDPSIHTIGLSLRIAGSPLPLLSMWTRRFAQPWLAAAAGAAAAAAVILPFAASPYAPPELLTAFALLVAGLAGFLGGPLPGLAAVLAGLGSVAVVVDRPGRV